MLAPFFIFLGIDLLFIILAILFFCGKGSFLIAGYNTASKAERAKYDEKALCRAMGWDDVCVGCLLARNCAEFSL